MRIFIMILVGFSLLWGEHFWSDWRSNYRQDGLSPLIGPRDPNFLWEYEFGTVGKESKKNNLANPYYSPGATAVISSDSTVYAFSNECLMAIKDDQVLWRETFNSDMDMNIVIDSEGILYFPVINSNHRLVAFDPKARIILWYSEQSWGTGTRNVTLGPDSILYVTFYDTSFRAI
ncbi:MAG: hypothetical protein JXA60_05165, partial [Candidatus Coatesbacteria bacterium]|nr:hypothetical protein [Candidatus Coatesbacteria bacterium]